MSLAVCVLIFSMCVALFECSCLLYCGCALWIVYLVKDVYESCQHEVTLKTCMNRVNMK
jgi:hypothetical protein